MNTVSCTGTGLVQLNLPFGPHTSSSSAGVLASLWDRSPHLGPTPRQQLYPPQLTGNASQLGFNRAFHVQKRKLSDRAVNREVGQEV